MPSPLQLSTHRTGDRLLIELSGEWDAASEAVFDACARDVLSRPAALVVVDLGQLQFISSIGLHACAGLAAASLHTWWNVVFVRGSHEVQRAFKIVGLDGRLNFVGHVEDAAGLFD